MITRRKLFERALVLPVLASLPLLAKSKPKVQHLNVIRANYRPLLLEGDFVVRDIRNDPYDYYTLLLQRETDGLTRTWGPMKRLSTYQPYIGEQLNIRVCYPS